MPRKKMSVEEMPKTFEDTDLATIVYPSDRYPALVVARTRTTITLARLDTNKLPPGAISEGGYVQSWRFSIEEARARLTTRLDTAYYSFKKDRYYINTTVPVRLGQAEYHRNWGD